MRTRRATLKALGAATIAGLAGCTGGNGGDGGDGGSGGGSDGTTESSGSDGTATGTATSSDGGGGGEQDTVTAAYVYNESVTDLGWVHTHEVAREALEEKYDWYETRVVEEVTVSEAESTFADLANQDVDVVEAATFGYGEPAGKVVADNDIYIESPRMAPVGNYEGPNLGYYLGRLEEACYAVGIAAGMLTESNTLGYVNSFPIPSVTAELNALVLGAKSVNPDITMKVRYVNSWFDPPKERDAANALMDEGADVMGYRVSNPATIQAAAERDVWSYGYADGFSGTEIAYDKYITSRMWNWEPFFDATAKWARKGQPGAKERFNLDTIRGNYFGFEEGGIQLDEFGSAVPSDVQSEVTGAVDALASGDMTGSDMFSGTEFADMSAYERSTQTGSYVDGIEGELPS
jgi:basic membrane protein A